MKRLRALKLSPSAWIGLGMVATFILVGIFGPLLAPYDVSAQSVDLAHKFRDAVQLDLDGKNGLGGVRPLPPGWSRWRGGSRCVSQVARADRPPEVDDGAVPPVVVVVAEALRRSLPKPTNA